MSKDLKTLLTETIARLGAEWPKPEREQAMRVAQDMADLYVRQALGQTGVEREIAHCKAAAANIVVRGSISVSQAIADGFSAWLDRVTQSFLGLPFARAAPEPDGDPDSDPETSGSAPA